MELLWKLINPNSNAPITGGAAGTAYKIRRGADGNLFDFDDMTFKASGWTTLSAALSEVDAAHLPGVYRGSIDTTLWQNGEYQFDATYSAGNVLLYATDRVALQDGVEAVTVGAVNDKTGYVLDFALVGIHIMHALRFNPSRLQKISPSFASFAGRIHESSRRKS